MNTTTISKQMTERFEREAEREREQEREAVLRDLREAEQQAATQIPPLDEKYSEAFDKLTAAEQAMKEARRIASEAEHERDSAARRHSQRIDGLRSRLETDLRDPRISAALEKLEALAEKERSKPIPSVESDPGRREEIASAMKLVSRRLEWIRSEARPAILAMQFEQSGDLESKIESILAGLPAIA